MKSRRILIVGGLAAGPSAAAKAVRTNPNAEVTMFEATETISYGICEAPYAIAGIIADENKLVSYTPDRLREEKGVTVKTLHRVEKIVPSEHRLLVRDISKREMIEYEYDKLIIATGAQPRRLNVQGEDARNVFHLGSREDTRGIMKYIKDESPAHAVIIGGGYVGMEMAEALRVKGLDVTIVHRHRLPMAGLETETRERIFDELHKNEVHFITNARIEQLQTGSGGKVHHVITNRGTFDADIVILSLGVTPNIALAKQAKIRLGATGAIAVNERQQTSVDDIYAAGDCSEIKNTVSGKAMFVPLATYASRAAWVAGENAAGGRASFKGAIRAIAVKVFGVDVAQVGLSSDEAKEAGFDVVTDSITSYAKVALMPESAKLTVKLIVDRTSQRLLGANVYGGDGAVLRANTLGVAIQQGLTLDDISRFDMIYAPPFAPLWDPILIAANQAKKKLE
jgi:NADPH-dependent 2,4-dienoyl-CoA reductase/sulfur reductase-like enzyme